MEFGVNLDQTAVYKGHEMTWNFHDNPCRIFYRVYTYFETSDTTLIKIRDYYSKLNLKRRSPAKNELHKYF